MISAGDNKKHLLKWAVSLMLPIMMQQLLLVVVNTVDSLMMGQLSETAMTTVSQSAQIFYIFTVISNGIAGTCVILVAQYWGKRDNDSIKTIISFSLRLGVLLGAAAFALIELAPSSIFRIFSNDPTVIEMGVKYIRITAFMCPLYGISSVMYSTFKGVERTRLVFWGNTVCYILTIILNYCLVFGKFGLPKLGYLGAAVGALCARIVEVVFVLVCFFKLSDIGYRPSDIKRRSALLTRDFFKTMAPIAGHELIWAIGISMSQMTLGQLSTAATAAFNIAYVFDNLLAAMIYGLGGAATTITGKLIGENDIEGVKKTSRKLMLYAIILSAAGAAVMLLGRDFFVSLYTNVSAETVEFARSYVIIMAGVLFFQGWEIVGLVSILRAGGDGKTGFITDCIVMWMIAIPLGLLAAYRWRLSPVIVVLLFKIDMPMKSIVSLVRVLRMKWIHNLTRDNASAE